MISCMVLYRCGAFECFFKNRMEDALGGSLQRTTTLAARQKFLPLQKMHKKTHKNTAFAIQCVMQCCPEPSRLIRAHLHASPPHGFTECFECLFFERMSWQETECLRESESPTSTHFQSRETTCGCLDTFSIACVRTSMLWRLLIPNPFLVTGTELELIAISPPK